MPEAQARTAMLIGAGGVAELARCRVAVFGLGGVGGAACEALARSGIGALDLFDDDVVAPSNLNRQLVALHSTVGRPKVEVMRDRIADINPAAEVEARQLFVHADSIDRLPLHRYDYVVDAVDNMAAKLLLVQRAFEAGTPVISCMGTGNKLDPARFEVADLADTSVCPLARIMRRELRRRGIEHVKVVYSREEPREQQAVEGRHPPGSLSAVPPVAGMLLAAAVLRDLGGV